MGSHFSITDLAREFAVTNRAIRFYEDEGLISPERDGQRRVYSQRDRVRLMLILRGRRLGFSLKEIREIIDLYDADPNEVAQLRHFLSKIRERRDQLRSQQEDIQAILTELDAIESQCDSLLKAKQQ
jgi:DNA-binding transcriptional MerR regulator